MKREPLLYLPIGIFVGFALSMLVDNVMHLAFVKPPWEVTLPPMHEMTRQAFHPARPILPAPFDEPDASH
jgi:hypothetical protein